MIDDEDALEPRRPRWAVRAIALLAALLLALNLARLGIRSPEPGIVPSPTASLEPTPTLSPSGSPSGKPLASMPVEIRRVAKHVERIRGLRFLEPVNVEVVSQAQLDRRLRRVIDEAIDPVEIARTDRTWTLLGLLDPDDDLLAAIEALNEGGVAGYYDEETDELVVGTDTPDALSPLARYYVAHELTHALQDQHHGLDRLRTLAEGVGKADEAVAFRALVEGDAVLVAERYRVSFDSAEQSAYQREQAARDRSALARVPGALLETFGFSYRAGTRFAQHLLDRGGFRRIDRAYERRPRTTAEILHPDRFPARAPVQLPLQALPGGWKRLEAEAFGEFDLSLTLRGDPAAPLMSATDAARAADGWAGGRYRACGARGETVVEIALAFSTQAEALQANDAIEDYLDRRAGSDAVTFQDDGWRGWRGSISGAVRIDGKRVRLLVASSGTALDAHR